MDAQRWAQIEELFHRACECDPLQRARLLQESCTGDAELRGTVEMLLASEEGAANDLEAAVHSGLDAVAFPLVGETISHYRILGGIDTGGMGSVYRAEDIKLGRHVALKFLAEEFARDPAALSRFEREARSASALEHPNICPIYEFGEHAGQPFLAMQLLEGQTLREFISRNGQARPPFALPELLNLALQITEALDAAHRYGIIHRDIKPANIFITREGQGKILDFGLAKPTYGEIAGGDPQRTGGGFVEEHREGGGTRPPSTPDAFLSRTGVALGTTAYMSPEQARGEKLDARTDIFSLGLVLYEMATGRRAFEGATEPILHDAIFPQTPAPLRRLNPTLPAEFETIVRRCLERNRDARYPTAAQLRANLEGLRAKAGRKLPYRSGIAVAAGLALLTAVALLWFAGRHATAPPSPNANLRQLTTNSWENPVKFDSISPDGRYLAYTDTKGIHIKIVGSEESQLVPQPEALGAEKVVWEIGSSAWSQDSRRFVVTSHPATEDSAAWASPTSSIWVASVSGGAPHKLRDAARAWNVSPDGASVSFGTSKGRLGERELWMMGFDGGQARKVLEVDDPRAICCLYFFRDGTRVAYATHDDSGDTLVARDLKGGPVVTLLPPTATHPIIDFVWLSDGRLIYTHRSDYLAGFDAPRSLWIERFDTRSGKLTERARRLTTVTGASLSVPSATSDGRLVTFVRSAGYGTAYVADMEAGATGIRNVRHFTLDEGDDSVDDWTPDSQTAIIVRSRGDHSAVYKQSLHSDVAEPIVARLDGVVEAARVSPDAKWVILLIWPHASPPAPPNRGGAPPQVWRVPINGGPLQRLFPLAPGGAYSCARAPATLCVTGEPTTDGRQAIVSAFDPVTGLRGGELLRFDRHANPAQDEGLLVFDLSPDGQWLSTSSPPSGLLRILSLRGAPERVLPVKGLNLTTGARWTSDGKGLIVSGYGNDGPVLLHVDLQANVHVLLQCESGGACLGVPSPDGRYLGIYQVRTMSNIWMVENF